jgi:hypothetical protein
MSIRRVRNRKTAQSGGSWRTFAFLPHRAEALTTVLHPSRLVTLSRCLDAESESIDRASCKQWHVGDQASNNSQEDQEVEASPICDCWLKRGSIGLTDAKIEKLFHAT